MGLHNHDIEENECECLPSSGYPYHKEWDQWEADSARWIGQSN